MGSKGSALSGVQGQRPWPCLTLLAVLTAARLWVAAITPLSPDEAYYWVWSRALAPGYFDHPPMVALWIRAGTLLAGDGPIGVRLLGPLAAALGSILLWRAGEDLRPGSGLVAAVLLNATLLFGVGAVTMTPDTPLLLFWTLALWALARLLVTGNGAWWLAVGAACGLALESKYTAALLPPAILLWLLAIPNLRPWLRRPTPWLGVSIALALCLPMLAWNADHGWVSFAKQGARTSDWNPSRAPQYLGELLASQFGFATPVIAILCTAGMVSAVRKTWRGDPAWTLLAMLTLLPALVFLQHALGDRVQANWPSVIYPAAAIAAAGLHSRWVRPGAALGLALTLLVWVQAAFAPLALPMRLDPTLLRLGGWDSLADSIAAAERREAASFVVSDNYGHAALLARLLPDTIPVYGLDARWALFDLPDARPRMAGKIGILVRSARRDDSPAPSDWSSITRLGEVPRARNGMTAELFRLYRVVGRAGDDPIAVMPRPNG